MRRLKILKISPGYLRDLFLTGPHAGFNILNGLSNEAEIVSISTDNYSQEILVKIYDPAFPVVPEFDVIPFLGNITRTIE